MRKYQPMLSRSSAKFRKKKPKEQRKRTKKVNL